MANDGGDALVISDSEGNYYVLPNELLEVTKVKPEAKSAVDEHLAEVSGFASDYLLVGSMTIPQASQWSSFSPTVGWPYYRPATPGEDVINPQK